MPKILKNYTYNKKKDTYKILDYENVFADMPVAEMEIDAEYENILVVPINNKMTVVDKEEFLKFHKKFLLVVGEDGKVLENPNGQAIYLPKDTDVSKLVYINGQLLLKSEEPVQEEKETLIEEEKVGK